MVQQSTSIKHLSASTDGRQIKVGATATPGTLLHTATAEANELDELVLWFTNTSASAVLMTLEWGGTTSPDDYLRYTVPPRDGELLVVSGRLISGGLLVRAFAATADVIMCAGRVHRHVAE